jgi:hypothetical protein
MVTDYFRNLSQSDFELLPLDHWLASYRFGHLANSFDSSSPESALAKHHLHAASCLCTQMSRRWRESCRRPTCRALATATRVPSRGVPRCQSRILAYRRIILCSAAAAASIARRALPA